MRVGPRWYVCAATGPARFCHHTPRRGFAPHYLEGRAFLGVALCGVPIYADAMEGDPPNRCPECMRILHASEVKP
jgi:hypothetical protein